MKFYGSFAYKYQNQSWYEKFCLLTVRYFEWSNILSISFNLKKIFFFFHLEK